MEIPLKMEILKDTVDLLARIVAFQDPATATLDSK
jgi:hypothetical protein